MHASQQIDCTTAASLAASSDASRIGPAERQERLQAAAHKTVQRMIDEHSRLVFRVAFSALRNWADAEDVVQETFLQLLRTAPERLAEGVIEDECAYLARIAWRLAARRRQRPMLEDLPHEFSQRETPPDPPSSDRTPEQAALDRNLESWLHRQIDALPPKLRQPLALAAMGELTSPQIATVLGIPEGSVRRRIHSARQILRKQMERRQG